MSAENGKVCCNCRHCIRKRDIHDRVICVCEITDKCLGYSHVMEWWCRHWASDEEKWRAKDDKSGSH